MVLRAEDYRWSSAAAHCLRREDPVLTDLGSIPPLISDWSTWVADEEDPAELTATRKSPSVRQSVPLLSTRHPALSSR